jgi:hypothetical protein
VAILHNLFTTVDNKIDIAKDQVSDIIKEINEITEAITSDVTVAILESLLPNEQPFFFQGIKF